jgi:hypothetical protein
MPVGHLYRHTKKTKLANGFENALKTIWHTPLFDKTTTFVVPAVMFKLLKMKLWRCKEPCHVRTNMLSYDKMSFFEKMLRLPENEKKNESRAALKKRKRQPAHVH